MQLAFRFYILASKHGKIILMYNILFLDERIFAIFSDPMKSISISGKNRSFIAPSLAIELLKNI